MTTNDLDLLRRVAEALEGLRLTASLLQQNSEGCAQNHYGEDFSQHGKPAWLTHTAADIHRGASALTDLRALIARLDEHGGRS